MNTSNLKSLILAGITATSLVCLPAMAKNDNSQGHKGNKSQAKNHYSSQIHPNINAYRNASPNASFKRGFDKHQYRVIGEIDRDVYDRSVILDRNDDYVRIRTPENNVVTVINDTLQIIDILLR